MKRIPLLCILALATAAAAHAPPLEQLPDTALAQVVAPAPEKGIGDKLLELVTPGSVGTGLGLALSALGGLAFMTQRRKRVVALAAYHAFHIVEDIGNELEGDDGFDKAAAYLKKLDEYLVANGWRPLKVGEVDAAKLTGSALHGAEVAKTKVAVAAAEAAAAASSPVPASP